MEKACNSAALDIFPKRLRGHHEASSCHVDENKGIDELWKHQHNDCIGFSFQMFLSIIALSPFSKHALDLKLLNFISYYIFF